MKPLTSIQIHYKPSTILNDRIVEICNETNALVGSGDLKKLKALKDESSQIVSELQSRRKQILEAACY